MDVDEDRIDEAVLALLWLTLHDGVRAWKGHDWDTLDRLHRKGLILDPANKAKSVALTEEGLREAERLFDVLFAAATVGKTADLPFASLASRCNQRGPGVHDCDPGCSLYAPSCNDRGFGLSALVQ